MSLVGLRAICRATRRSGLERSVRRGEGGDGRERLPRRGRPNHAGGKPLQPKLKAELELQGGACATAAATTITGC